VRDDRAPPQHHQGQRRNLRGGGGSGGGGGHAPAAAGAGGRLPQVARPAGGLDVGVSGRRPTLARRIAPGQVVRRRLQHRPRPCAGESGVEVSKRASERGEKWSVT
jgi:hypothetical protein